MLLKRLFAVLGAATLFGLSSGAMLPAHAQQAGQPNPLQGFNLPPSLFFGFLGQASGGTDPTHSAALQLLQRNDVRNEIGRDLKQQNALDDLRTKSQQDFQETMRTSAQEGAKVVQSAPQEEQKDHIQTLMDSFATTMQNFQSDQDKHTEAILTPKQVKRLRELDLRWRGPLALSDPKVAAALKLLPDQTAKVSLLLKDYMDGQQKALMKAIVPAISPNGNAQDNGDTAPQDPRQQMQKKINEALHSKELEKAKADAEAKLLEMLSPAQKDQWTTMQGARFTFRTNEVN